jgi:hypothetical protein
VGLCVTKTHSSPNNSDVSRGDCQARIVHIFLKVVEKTLAKVAELGNVFCGMEMGAAIFVFPEMVANARAMPFVNGVLPLTVFNAVNRTTVNWHN